MVVVWYPQSPGREKMIIPVHTNYDSTVLVSGEHVLCELTMRVPGLAPQNL